MPSYIELTPRSILIRQENRKLRNKTAPPVKRGEVKRFSKNSQRRLAKLLFNNAEKFTLFFTVTYRKNHKDCKISKRHIDYFLTRFRKACGSHVGYTWVLEFQKRGAVHFQLWFENFDVKEFDEWKGLPIREQIKKRFEHDAENLNRFKFLTYLWLRVSNQLDDKKNDKGIN